MDAPAAAAGEGGVDLEKELTCSICTELLYQPLTLLDCLHTFCGSCLAEWFTFQHATYVANPSPPPPPSGGSIYTCPSCRAVVRDTKHNATVRTLLDMYLTAHPDHQRSAAEKEEIAAKYKPGDRVMPKVRVARRSERERRADEEDQRIIDQVRIESLREAGIMSDGGSGSGGTGRRREERRRERERDDERAGESRTRPPRSRNPSRDSRLRRESRDRSQRPGLRPESRTSSGDESRSHRSSLRPDQGTGSDTEGRRRPRRPESRRRSEDGADSPPLRQVEHQSSLRELIASDSDAQREIEEFSRQIQEEGLLDGLDLNNIDLSEDSELSRRITAAYRRRQRNRSRTEPSRRSNASAMSRNSENVHTPGSGNGSDSAPPRLRPADATAIASSRPASRQAMHARTTSSTSQAEERSRPPVSNAFLDPRSDAERRRRRRTSSESRSATDPARPSAVDVRPAIRSTSDLPSRTRRRADSAGSAARPVTADGRSAGSHAVVPPAHPSGHNLPFSARMPPMTAMTEAVQTSPPQELPAEVPGPTRQRKSRPADISVPTPATTAPPTSAVGGTVTAPLPSPGLLDPTSVSARPKVRSHTYIEPLLHCSTCNKRSIQYDIHYNCSTCGDGNWNICLDCYRNRKGCQHWFGFGREAHGRWEKKKALSTSPLESPHILAARRYVKPRTPPTANERGQAMTAENPEARLQSGNFCSGCLAWANDCCWRCTRCNFGDWGYCNDCVNTGNCCTHPLLPLTFRPDDTPPTATGMVSPPPSPRSPNPPHSASVVDSHSMFHPFKPLTFTTTCDMCRQKIFPTDPRLHCYECKSALLPDAKKGDYDICLPCYSGLGAQGRISRDNSMSGWRRCPAGGHRMAVVTFEEEEYGRRRVVVRQVVGGLSLEKEGFSEKLERWKWPTGSFSGTGFASRLVSKNVAEGPPAQEGGRPAPDYPPNGGLGKHAIALYGWYPGSDPERQDELMIPKMAEIAEIIEENETFWRGAYMGKVGFFPAAYVKILDE